MKHVVISGLVAALVCVALFAGYLHSPLAISQAPVEPAATPVAANLPSWHVTDELVEDGWVNGARAPGADRKPLAHADNSVCFLTKIEIKGIQSPADTSSCRIDIDEFTGFWQVTAAVEEGGASEVRCNARCLVWEEAQ